MADTRGQASINAASVQYELRKNDLILRDYGHLKYRKIDDPRPEPTLESDEDWQAMNCVLDNGVRILSRSRGQKVRGLKHRQHRPKLVIADDVEGLDWVRTQENRDKSDRWFRGDVFARLYSMLFFRASRPDNPVKFVVHTPQTMGISYQKKVPSRTSARGQCSRWWELRHSL